MLLALSYTLLLATYSFASPTARITTSPDMTHHNASTPPDYRRAHAYPSSYSFDKRDGWEPVPISDLSYKYVVSNASASAPAPAARRRTRRRKSSKSAKPKSSSSAGLISATELENLVDSMKPQGSPESVTVTWYSGDGLLNPSCWAGSSWAPTDDSFACAVTLDGWANRPKCFKFLELCNGPSKCVFVRVVDTCGGCQAGSKHVDVTQAAFRTLAPLSEGVLNVQMRLASDPDDWSVPLWGPRL